MKLVGIIRVNFDVTNQILITYSAFVTLKKRAYTGAVHKLLTGFKKVYNSVRRDVLYNVLIEFGIPTERVILIKICVNKIHRCLDR